MEVVLLNEWDLNSLTWFRVYMIILGGIEMTVSTFLRYFQCDCDLQIHIVRDGGSVLSLPSPNAELTGWSKYIEVFSARFENEYDDNGTVRVLIINDRN